MKKRGRRVASVHFFFESAPLKWSLEWRQVPGSSRRENERRSGQPTPWTGRSSQPLETENRVLFKVCFWLRARTISQRLLEPGTEFREIEFCSEKLENETSCILLASLPKSVPGVPPTLPPSSLRKAAKSRGRLRQNWQKDRNSRIKCLPSWFRKVQGVRIIFLSSMSPRGLVFIECQCGRWWWCDTVIPPARNRFHVKISRFITAEGGGQGFEANQRVLKGFWFF